MGSGYLRSLNLLTKEVGRALGLERLARDRALRGAHVTIRSNRCGWTWRQGGACEHTALLLRGLLLLLHTLLLLVVGVDLVDL